jgi:hypothetical protein
LFREVSDVAKRFAGKASPTKLSPRVTEWLNQYYGNTVAAVVGNLIATNTASTMTIVPFGGINASTLFGTPKGATSKKSTP